MPEPHGAYPVGRWRFRREIDERDDAGRTPYLAVVNHLLKQLIRWVVQGLAAHRVVEAGTVELVRSPDPIAACAVTGEGPHSDLGWKISEQPAGGPGGDGRPHRQF